MIDMERDIYRDVDEHPVRRHHCPDHCEGGHHPSDTGNGATLVTETIIAIMDGEFRYKLFNTAGFFLGNRGDLAGCLVDINEYDDLDIEKFASSMGMTARYYAVPMEQVASFCSGFGTDDGLDSLETQRRRTFYVAPNGAYIPAFYCKRNTP
jgi:hypothetical protein